MNRKECNHIKRIAPIILVVIAHAVTPARAETVRIWPSAVVSTDEVTLRDTCDLTRLPAATRAAVGMTVVSPAPPPGGSTQIDARDVQDALERAGVNLATVVLSGAIRCGITRPLDAGPRSPAPVQSDPTATRTLRAAVQDAFRERAARFGGGIDLRFGRIAPQLLELTEPRYRFDVQIPEGRWIGHMINVNVDVFEADVRAKSVHLVVNASLTRRVVVARRAINLKSAIRGEDVEYADRTYDDADRLGITDTAAVVGQRAKRFIRAGDAIRTGDLETVPLVKRGQIVDVLSTAGGVQVRSVAKAASAGGLGDTVELRMGDGRGERITGVVTGQREVAIVSPSTQDTHHETLIAAGRNHES